MEDLQSDTGATHEIFPRREPNWMRRERQMIQDAAHYWTPQCDALERLLWSQVKNNHHG